VPVAGVDGVPAALAVLAPAGADQWRRALGWVAVLVAVDEAVAAASLRRPGPGVIEHEARLAKGV